MNSAGDRLATQFLLIALMGLRELLNHPAGPKTIHFWAPAMKWGLVMAGLADINRPAESISVPQTLCTLLSLHKITHRILYRVSVDGDGSYLG